MLVNVLDGICRKGLGNQPTHVRIRWEIMHDGADDQTDQRRVKNELILRPVVARQPAREDRHQKRREKRYEQNQKAKMKAGHRRAENEKRQLFGPPRKPESDLGHKESQEESQENFSAHQVERHRLPLQDIGYVYRLRQRHIEGINREARAVRSDGQHREAYKENQFQAYT